MRWRCVLSAAAGLLQFGPDFLEPYRCGVDESWMLQSGCRLHRGQGLTSSLDDDLSDLSRPKYSHLHFWAPLHGFLYAGLLSLDVGEEGALRLLKLVKALAAFAGMLGWLTLGNRLLPAGFNLLFALGLSSALFASGEIASPAHLYFWAVMPWFLMGLTDAIRTGRTSTLLAAGALAGLTFAMRYQAAYVTAAGLAAIVLLAPGTARGRLRSAVVFGLPAALIAGSVLLFNRLGRDEGDNSGIAWMIDKMPTAEWSVENLRHREPIIFLFARGFGFEETLYSFKPSWKSASFLYILPWYALFVVAAWACRNRLGSDRRRFAATVAVSAACLIGLLGVISFRGEPIPGWHPIAEPRLYGELLAAVALVWLTVLAVGAVRLPHWSGVLCVGLTLATAAFEARDLFRTSRTAARRVVAAWDRGIEAPSELETTLRKLKAESPVPDVVVFDRFDGSALDMRRSDEIRFVNFQGDETVRRIGSSRPILLIVVVRRPWDAGRNRESPDWGTEQGERHAQALRLPKTGEARDGDVRCDLHTGVVGPWRPGTVPRKIGRAVRPAVATAGSWEPVEAGLP